MRFNNRTENFSDDFIPSMCILYVFFRGWWLCCPVFVSVQTLHKHRYVHLKTRTSSWAAYMQMGCVHLNIYLAYLADIVDFWKYRRLKASTFFGRRTLSSNCQHDRFREFVMASLYSTYTDKWCQTVPIGDGFNFRGSSFWAVKFGSPFFTQFYTGIKKNYSMKYRYTKIFHIIHLIVLAEIL